MEEFKILLQLFAEEENEEESNIDTAIADTVLDFQNKYEEEKKKRIEAENKVIQMTKLIRNLPVTNTKQEEKKENTLNDNINLLFGVKG